VIVASLVLILVAVTLLVLGLSSGSSELLVSSIGASLLAAVALVVGARQAAAARSGTGSFDDERVSRAGDEDDEPRVFHHRSTARSRRSAAWGADESSVAVAEPMQATVPTQGTYRSAESDDRYDADGRYAGADAGYDTDDGYGTDAGYGGPAAGYAGPDAGYAGPDAGYAGPDAGYGAQTTYGSSGPVVDDSADDGPDGDDADPADEPAPQYVSPTDAARVARMPAPVLVIDGRPRYHLAGCVHLLGREGEPLPVSEAVELGFTPCSLCEPDSALLAESRRV
jgi:hypothetical protein